MNWNLNLQYQNLSDYVCYLQTKGWRSISALWAIRNVRRKLIILPFTLIGLLFLYSWTVQSHSSTLLAFNGLVIFDILTLIADIVVQWLSVTKSTSSATGFSFGFVRVEVLIHFVVLCVGILLNIQSIFTIVEYTFLNGGDDDEIHLGRFLPVALLGGLIHFLLSFNNNPLLRVYKVSCTYTSLQNYFQGICASFGLSLSSSSLFSHSPIGILGLFSLTIIVVLAFGLEQSNGSKWIDGLGGGLIVFGIFDAIVPLCLYTGQVLLQTVPSHVATQLEKALREALTIDGVLEFRNELFWTLTYGQIAGTLHVRVRRDANEQLVLSKVYEKLQPLAPHLTIQVTKDDNLNARHFGSGSLQILRTGSSTQSSSPSTYVNIFGGDFHTPSDISPIPPAHGTHNQHLIFTNANSSGTKLVSSVFPRDDNNTVLTMNSSNPSSTTSLYPPDTSELLRETLIKGPSTHAHIPNHSQLNHTNVLISNSNYFSE